MGTLNRAIEIALEAHDGQYDKSGAPYILHPLRVMLSFDRIDAQIVGVLHDVIEDDEAWTPARLLEEGFPEAIVRAMEALTKNPGEPYLDYLHRVSTVPLATAVKMADLKDNLRTSRLGSIPTEADEARFKKYRDALEWLSGLQSSR